MNILYTKLSKGYFGGEKQTEELIRGLQKKGHNLFLLSLPNSEISQRLIDIPQTSFNLYPYPNKRTKSLIFLCLLPYFLIKFYFLAIKIVKENKIDLVCLQEPYEKVICGPVFKLLKVKVCWLEVTFWEPYLKDSFIIFNLMLWSSPFCDGIIFSSNFLKQQIEPYQKKYNSRIKMIVIRHALKKEDKLKFISLKKAKYPIKNIGYIGSVEVMKGIFVLLEAFKILLPFNPMLKLIIAGDGESIDKLRQNVNKYKLNNSVNLIGKTKPEIFYDQIDLLVVPSCYDNLPYVIQESFCARRPVVASKIGGIPEYFSGKEKQWLYKPGDSNELANKIRKILKINKNTLDGTTISNYNFYRKNFDFDNMLKKTERFFKNL